MKTIFKSIFFVALAGILFSSCAKNDDFSVPSINCEEPNVTINKTIDDLYSLAEITVKPYSGDPQDILKGVVVSSDKGGNFHNKIHLVDERTQKPLIVNLENGTSFVQYPPGTIIYIRLGGLYFNTNYGVVNVGGGTNGKYTTTIPKGSIDKYIGKYCKPVSNFNDYNPVITLAELNEKKEEYKGRLVTIKDVQFNRKVVGKTLYDKTDVDSQGQTLREMVDKDNRTFFVRTSQYSTDFTTYEIPKYSGSITGIVDIFNNIVQFYPRVLDDINLKDQPFGDDEGPIDPGDNIELGKFLAFPGADFENWDAFLGVIFKNQLSDATAQKAEGQGWENSTGLAVKGTRVKNGYLFSVEKVKMPTDATKLSFVMKGKAAKSLSINVHKANGVNYYAYNLESVTTSKVLQPNMTETEYNGVPSGNTTNIYGGTIDTNNKWVKITLDLSALNGDYHKTGTGTFISFRNGNEAEYDLVIDEIRFEDGTPVEDDGGPVDPEPGDPFVVADFNAWDGFVSTLNNFGLKPYATHAPGQGRNGKDAMKLSGTTTGNDYVFTITNKEVIAGKTKLVVWIKGTSTSKSLSFNVNKSAGGYDPFNAGTVATENLELSKFTTNQYNGSIDTNNQWVKLTLDLTDTAYNTTGSGDVFSLKTGSGSTYELLIDSIYFE